MPPSSNLGGMRRGWPRVRRRTGEGGGVKEENGEVKSNLFPSISVTAVINLYTPWLELCDGGWDVFLFKSCYY